MIWVLTNKKIQAGHTWLIAAKWMWTCTSVLGAAIITWFPDFYINIVSQWCWVNEQQHAASAQTSLLLLHVNQCSHHLLNGVYKYPRFFPVVDPVESSSPISLEKSNWDETSAWSLAKNVFFSSSSSRVSKPTALPPAAAPPGATQEHKHRLLTLATWIQEMAQLSWATRLWVWFCVGVYVEGPCCVHLTITDTPTVAGRLNEWIAVPHPWLHLPKAGNRWTFNLSLVLSGLTCLYDILLMGGTHLADLHDT